MYLGRWGERAKGRQAKYKQKQTYTTRITEKNTSSLYLGPKKYQTNLSVQVEDAVQTQAQGPDYTLPTLSAGQVTATGYSRE